MTGNKTYMHAKEEHKETFKGRMKDANVILEIWPAAYEY